MRKTAVLGIVLLLAFVLFFKIQAQSGNLQQDTSQPTYCSLNGHCSKYKGIDKDASDRQGSPESPSSEPARNGGDAGGASNGPAQDNS